jgi:hypothetical protein
MFSELPKDFCGIWVDIKENIWLGFNTPGSTQEQKAPTTFRNSELDT